MSDHPAPPGPVTVLLTPDGTITEWSEGAGRLFGHDAAAAVGAALPALLGGSAAEALLGA